MKLFFNIPINFTQLFFFTLLCPLFAVCALKSRVSAFEEIIFDPCAGYLHSNTPDNGKSLQAPFLILPQFSFSSRAGLFFVQIILKVEVLAEFHSLDTCYVSASSVCIAWAGLDRGSPGGTSRPAVVAAGN